MRKLPGRRAPSLRTPKKRSLSQKRLVRARRAPARNAGSYTRGANARLKRFRQGSRLTVAVTALLLLTWGVPVSSDEGVTEVETESLPTDSVNEATGTIRELFDGFTAILPKVAIAIAILVFAFFLARGVKALLTRTLGSWNRATATGALAQVGIFLLAVGVALSVIAGDARALVGSVGLVGLALSWALQTPIESFTGWLMNSFKSYYEVGDRIEVGEVFGDVYKIDILTTTVWEAGGSGKTVQGAQPTGALITFPNSEVLKANIINYTRDFPYVWDEVVQGVTNESDLEYAVQMLEGVACSVVGDMMRKPAEEYREKIAKKHLVFDIASDPTVFVSTTDAWTNLTVRYLVPARERRKWASRLIIAISKEMSDPRHAGKVQGSLPRAQLDLTQEAPPHTPQL